MRASRSPARASRSRTSRVIQVDRLVTAGEIPPPGFGHRYHTIDPRATRLLQIAHELELDHEHAQLIRAIEHALVGIPRSRTDRCRSTSTARLPRLPATSACRRKSPTRCSSSRVCLAWPRTRSRSKGGSRRCVRSTRCHTPMTDRLKDAYRNAGNEAVRKCGPAAHRRRGRPCCEPGAPKARPEKR